MLRRGDQAGVFYRGDGRPARLYRGRTLIAGWTEQSKQAPAAWESTYNDAFAVAARGKGRQQAYSGKNLFDVEHVTEITFNSSGATVNASFWSITNEDGIRVLGTRQSLYSASIAWMTTPMHLVPGQYTVSFDAKLQANDNNMSRIYATFSKIIPNQSGRVNLRTVSTPIDFDVWTKKIAEITVAEEADYLLACGPMGNAQNYTTIWAYFRNIQVEAGLSATAYEPYVGGQPSPNPDYPQALEASEGTLRSLDRSGQQSSAAALPTLRAIPGTDIRDTAESLSGGMWRITRRVGVIESYAGESVGDTCASTTGQLTNGATVWYDLPTPDIEALDLGVPKTYPGYTALEVDGDYPPDVTATAKVVSG